MRLVLMGGLLLAGLLLVAVWLAVQAFGRSGADGQNGQAGQSGSGLDEGGGPAGSGSGSSVADGLGGHGDAGGGSWQDSRPQAPQLGGELSSWALKLVNPWNALSGEYTVKLTQLANGQAVDERCYPELQQMMNDCRAAGISPIICSSYRTYARQEELYTNKVNALAAQGYTENEARGEAAKWIAAPGTSEHQTGLAVDIVDVANQNLNETQAGTPTRLWLMENSWKYGFILRYPSGKSDVTGISYEPWHYRYVGETAARDMYGGEMCLEEYMAR